MTTAPNQPIRSVSGQLQTRHPAAIDAGYSGRNHAPGHAEYLEVHRPTAARFQPHISGRVGVRHDKQVISARR